MSEKRGLQLERVVLVGRTFEEYCQYFALDDRALAGKRILDVASGVGSFSAEARSRGNDATAVDPIYSMEATDIAARCAPDLEHILAAVQGLSTYVWKNYRDREHLRELREKAYKTFLVDYQKEKGRHYLAAALPKLPFEDSQFDLCLVSYFLFVYEEHFDYSFHRESILEIMRVTKGEARIYPTVTFEGQQSRYIEQLKEDPALSDLEFDIVETNFEFLLNSNNFLKVSRRENRDRKPARL
jgi:SAM-dependent methyltransferase